MSLFHPLSRPLAGLWGSPAGAPGLVSLEERPLRRGSPQSFSAAAYLSDRISGGEAASAAGPRRSSSQAVHDNVPSDCLMTFERRAAQLFESGSDVKLALVVKHEEKKSAMSYLFYILVVGVA